MIVRVNHFMNFGCIKRTEQSILTLPEAKKKQQSEISPTQPKEHFKFECMVLLLYFIATGKRQSANQYKSD